VSAPTRPKRKAPATQPKPAPSVTLDVSMDEFTLGELDDLEELLGMDLTDAFPRVQVTDDKGVTRWEQKRPSVSTILAVVLVVLRRQDPAATMKDARAMPLSRLNLDLGKATG